MVTGILRRFAFCSVLAAIVTVTQSSHANADAAATCRTQSANNQVICSEDGFTNPYLRAYGAILTDAFPKCVEGQKMCEFLNAERQSMFIDYQAAYQAAMTACRASTSSPECSQAIGRLTAISTFQARYSMFALGYCVGNRFACIASQL